MRDRLVLALTLAAAAGGLHAAEPQFWKIEGARAFLEGQLEQLSVDSEGRLRLAQAETLLHDTEMPYVWALARDEDGALFAGTGNEGEIYHVDKKGAARLLHDTGELEVHALAVGRDGELYAGSSPDGRVYRIDDDGEAETHYDPSDKYIWALAVDAEGRLLVATGLDGKLHRVDRKGEASVVLTSAETHLTAVAADSKGNVFVGSSPEGIVYRVDAQDKVFVLLDSAFREVKALLPTADGSVFVALIDGSGEKEKPQPVPQAPSPVTLEGTEVTLSAALQGTPAPPQAPVVATPPPTPAPAGGPKGAVLRIHPGGEVETLWSSNEETPYALAEQGGAVVVGTGPKGKVYRIAPDGAWSMIGALEAEQVTALVGGERGALLLATSNPGRLHRFETRLAQEGRFTSKVQDTQTVSSWGRIRWQAQLPEGAGLEVVTRSGNTGTPDSTWTDWSAPYDAASGSPVASETARFLQIRLTLASAKGAGPVVESVVAPYLQRNLRPQLDAITVHPPGVVFQRPISVTGQVEILGLEPREQPEQAPPAARQPRPRMPSPVTYSRRLYQKGVQTFSWKGEDPNDDELVYDVEYRALGEDRFRPLKGGLSDSVLAWDTSTVPNGRYVLRVRASDSPSNPESLALTAEKESTPFDVDNTPPSVSVERLEGQPLRVRALVKDESSLVRKAEYAVDGGSWEEVHPDDGINDSPEESYSIRLGALSNPGPHVLVVRATDLLGNVATAEIELP